MLRRTLITAFLLVAPLYAQYPGTIYTPEIQLGSATEPSIIHVPPIAYVTGGSYEPEISNATPADTEFLAQRHWDFVTSPMSGVEFWFQGSMADTSISLGEYTHQLRAQKSSPASQATPKPGRVVPPTH
jgi:hypothetical protein